jgi:hypothetical protein
VSRPFAYAVIDLRDDSLVGVYCCLKLAAPDATESLWGTRVHAFWPDGREETVPREAFRQPAPPTEAEALEFIRDRAKKIADSLAAGQDAAIWRASGCLRCDCDDPEDKQVADYIRTATWEPRAEPDEDWWRSLPAPSAGDGGSG